MQHAYGSSREEGSPSGGCLSPQSQLQHSPLQTNSHLLIDNTNQPMLNYDGTEMRDDKGRLVYKSQFLSTHPLKGDCKERVGYGGKKFTYVSGDGVIRTMNAVFGFGGWSSRITMERMVQCEKDDRGRWNIGYLATVKVTLRNGVSHEDCGSGDGINESKVKAHEKAIKSAVTDAMKRAARHFGERLGNALYVKGNGIKTAPKTNKDALIELEKNDALNLFGDQALLRANSKIPSPRTSMRPSLFPEGRCAASNDSNNAHKENLHHNRCDLTPVSSSTDSRHRTAVGLAPQSIHPQHTGDQFPTASPIDGGIPAQTIFRSDNRHHINGASHHNMPYAPNNMMQPPRPIYNAGRNGDDNAVGGVSSFTGIQYSNISNTCYSANEGKAPLEPSKRDSSRLDGDDTGVTNSNNNGNGGNSDDGNKRQKKNPYSRISI